MSSAARPTPVGEAPSGLSPTSSSEPRDWTILLYLDGRSDIERDVLNAFLTAEQVSRIDGVTVAAELGRAPQSLANPSHPDEVDGDWSGVRRYVLDPGPPSSPYDRRVYTSNGEHNGRIDSKLVADLGNADMSRTATLRDFLVWGMQAYPAKHYAVVLADHGMGYLGTLTDQVSRGEMRLPDLHAALSEVRRETGVKPDLLVMDACLMASAEAAHELRDDAALYLASEEVNYDCYPFQETFKELAEAQGRNTPLEPAELGRAFIESSRKRPQSYPYMSLVDLTYLGEVTEAVKALADALLATPADAAHVRDDFRKATHFSQDAAGVKPYDDYRDLAQIAAALAADPRIADENVKSAARAVDARLREGAVLASRDRREGEAPTGGLSIYAPTSGFKLPFGAQLPIGTRAADLEPTYRALAFTTATGWDKVLERFAAPPEPVQTPPAWP